MNISMVKRSIIAAAAVLGVTAATGAIAANAGLAGNEFSPWYSTNANAALSRANLKEQVLTPSTVSKVRYLRSVASPMVSAKAGCPQGIVAPVLVGGDVYAMTNGSLSKYDAATGALLWRSVPDPSFSGWIYESLTYSTNLVLVGAEGCQSISEPGGELWAYNATTGALVWKAIAPSALPEAVVNPPYVFASGADAAGYQAEVFNLSNGKSVWSKFSNCGAGDAPLVVGSLAMTYTCDSAQADAVQADNLATGTPVWTLDGAWVFQRGDAGDASGTHLYATNPSGTVVDLNPQTGQTVYSLSGAVKVLAVDASRVYATCNGTKGKDVCAYDIGTGALDWTYKPFFAHIALAAEAGGVLYLDNGAALNAATGKAIEFVWNSINYGTAQFPRTGLPVGAIAVGDGRIAVITDPRVLDLFGLAGS
jgi:hypothetical protein